MLFSKQISLGKWEIQLCGRTDKEFGRFVQLRVNRWWGGDRNNKPGYYRIGGFRIFDISDDNKWLVRGFKKNSPY